MHIHCCLFLGHRIYEREPPDDVCLRYGLVTCRFPKFGLYVEEIQMVRVADLGTVVHRSIVVDPC